MVILLVAPGLALGRPTVFAASSLTDALQQASAAYAEQTGEAPPLLVFGASSKIVRQIEAGAPASLVLTADEAWMDVLERAGLITERRALWQNSLVVVVPVGTTPPADAAGLADPRFVRIALAAQSVPAGRRAREALHHHGVLDRLGGRLVETTNVRGALALCARGEVDAALVYRSDALATQRVRIAFRFDEADHAPIVYPVALTHRGAEDPEARAFYRWLPEAQPIFAAAGFAAATAMPSAPTPVTPRAPVEGLSPVTLSLWVALASLLLSLVPAVFLGWLLARHEFVGKTLLSTLLMTPLVLPPVVTGFMLLRAFGRGGVLEGLGLQVAFTRFGAVLAAATVGFPLLVLMARLAIEAVDPRYEQLAQTLGRSRLGAFWKVTVPMAAPGLAAGAVLAFARGLGEFGATAVLAGDIPGETRTLALAVYALYEQPGREQEAQTLVWISIGLCLVALAGFERLSRLQKRRIEDLGG